MICRVCKRDLAREMFAPSAEAKRDYCCRECMRDQGAARRAANPDATRAAARERTRRHRALTPPAKRQRTPAEREAEKVREKKYAANNPEKRKARQAVNNAIAAGKLQRGSCEICGAEKAEAHHDDYAKPLAVRWLCAKHHRREHQWIA
jgi:hypothetical protein